MEDTEEMIEDGEEGVGGHWGSRAWSPFVEESREEKENNFEKGSDLGRSCFCLGNFRTTPRKEVVMRGARSVRVRKRRRLIEIIFTIIKRWTGGNLMWVGGRSEAV